MKICEYPYCTGEIVAKGYCRGHYTQLSRKQELRPLQERKVTEAEDTRVLTPEMVTHMWRSRLGKGK